MTTTESLLAEFDREVETTRRHLARLPEDKLTWRPHEKSFTAGGLASHLVECVGWGEAIFAADELDFDPAVYSPFMATSVPQLLETFDATASRSRRALAAMTDATLTAPWRLKVRGKQRFERPKAAAFRDFTLSHVIHHRGQLTVYLRLLDVPVPPTYGPTADEAI